MGIQINGITNNINAGIGSLSIEDISELDIVGVATASNFKTGSSNLHSTGLTVGNNFFHSTGINVGTGATIHVPASNTLTFGTNSKERVRVDSNGRLLLGTVRTYGTGPYYDDICINNSDQSGSAGGAGIDLISKSDNYGAITFSNESQHERGYIKFEHASGVNKLRFGTLGADRWQIYNDGHLRPATDSAYDIGSSSVRVRNGYFDTLYGDGSNLTGISAGPSLSGSTNNTVCTVTGSNAIRGETKLTFDSTTTQLKITRDDDSNSGFYVFHNDGSECARLVNKGSGHEGALLLQDGGTPTVYFDGETGSRSYINTGAGLAIGTQNLVSGRSDNVLHLHKASSGTADGPTIYFTNQQTGVTGSDGFTVGLNDAQSPYLWNRENTATRFGTNNAERLRIHSSGELWVGTTSGISNGGYGGISLNGSSGSLLSLMQNGTEYFRLFGDSNPALQFAGVLRLFSGVSGGSNIWSVTPNGTTTGANGVTFNLKSTISHTAAVMAVSSSYNAGDLYIRIDNIYNLAGNAWWTFGLWIMTNQTVGTLSGHHSAMIHCVITGLGSWSSLSANNIQGSLASNVSIDQHGTNFVELKVDVHDSSRGPCTVLCNGGTFDPPRISFH